MRLFIAKDDQLCSTCDCTFAFYHINWICDAENRYALKGLLYTGRSGEERQIGLANTIVEQLAQLFVNSYRNVFMDRYFASYSIVQHHLEQGTVSVNRDDVPLCLRQTRGRDVYSKLIIKGKWTLNRMEDVWYVPKLGLNLFSIGKAVEKGFKFIAYADGCTCRKNACVKQCGVRNLNGLQQFDVKTAFLYDVLKEEAAGKI
ncbi:hypothetical protein Tsp_11734 [Trichinella spiralis]|uniref:hypothetical protein n=1 Tax=Trichinella spiralis TaxID=6334 RepID=UPI0001EFE6EE|nr:hypothetical protein Tsp_11734 [Trichinella spiralis]